MHTCMYLHGTCRVSVVVDTIAADVVYAGYAGLYGECAVHMCGLPGPILNSPTPLPPPSHPPPTTLPPPSHPPQ